MCEHESVTDGLTDDGHYYNPLPLRGWGLKRQISGIDTIKYHIRPETPHRKVTKHKKNHHTQDSQEVSPSFQILQT